MKFLKQGILDFTSTNITETVPEYSPLTTYTFETGTPTNASLARVGSYIYRSLVSGNLGNHPEESINKQWVKWGASNAYSMLDMRSGTKTSLDGDIIVEFNWTRDDNTVVVGNYSASYIRVEVLDALDTVLWTHDTPNTLNDEVTDYWSYIYAEYDFEVDRAVMISVPSTIDPVKCRVTLFQYQTELTECGFLVAGDGVSMGETLINVSFNFNSFATKEFDTFGTANIIKRAVQDISDFETIIGATEIPSMKRKIKAIYDDVVVFIVDDNEDSRYENLITLGTIQDASVIHSNEVISTITWSIVEVVS